MVIPDAVESGSDLKQCGLRRRNGGLHDSPTEEESSCSEEEVVKESSSDECNGKSDNLNGGDKKEQVSDVPGVEFIYRASFPAHRRNKESPLSSDTIFRQSHAGLFNLCVVVLVAVNSRLIIENLMKVVVLLHIIITTATLLYPVLVILRCDSAFVFGVALMLFACIVWLKLVSYAHTNYDLRAISKSTEKGEAVTITLNIDDTYDVSFKSLVYFTVAPTLCYQPSYPRTPSIRKGWLLRQIVKLIIFTGVMGFIIEQYINPIVQNSQHPLKGNLLYAIERILKLSVPNLYVWFCMFYCFFHLWLNILAELLRFGDREFYKDWWNAKNVGDYWRLWNMPVHKWMIRHLYFPCIRNGIPKGVALLIAFLVSALFHELCIAIPCHIFKWWAFIGIMFQVPVVLITNLVQNKFQNSMVGNMTFWFTFCILGQPMCVLLYYHDLMNREGKVR
ncbi:PREDICTED: diacylglycerol O-acyltransferase 1-like isoform X2 [Lupinus angustifolius]|uniref:diacylglycerol O-acyltransferase 1-like isoform X2 n=1 Tax=Lupinus angustifolius TaxID=3871 RepID=UPI00092F6B1B|nr:PREDICTED: diacylglycerol O-acyltransferase 1-like isoform X2 [Lupinus angustifolius]